MTQEFPVMTQAFLNRSCSPGRRSRKTACKALLVVGLLRARDGAPPIPTSTS